MAESANPITQTWELARDIYIARVSREYTLTDRKELERLAVQAMDQARAFIWVTQNARG